MTKKKVKSSAERLREHAAKKRGRPENTRPARRVSLDEIVDRLLDAILTPKVKGGKSRLDDVMDKISYLRPTRGPTEGDPLLNHLLGFAPNEIPDFDNNFCAAMGRLLEAIVDEIFWCRRPRLYRQGWEADAEKLIDKGYFPKKWTSDLRIGDTAIEIKYRFASGQAITEQCEAGGALTALDYHPVMLMLRRDSPTEAALTNKGWTVYTGQEALKYIRSHADIDLIRVLKLLAARPSVRTRLAEWREHIRAQTDARRIASYVNATSEQRSQLHEVIARDADAVADILSRRDPARRPASRHRVVTTNAAIRPAGRLRARIEARSDTEIARVRANIDQVRHEASGALFADAFVELDPKTQAEQLSRLIDLMSDRARLELAALRA